MEINKKIINFYNPFSIYENILIKCYKYFSSPSKYLISSKFNFMLLILFKRIVFALINMNFSFYTQAKYRDIVFDARSTNSQFHSIYFDEYKNCYEPDVFASIECFLPIGGVFIDIGSNWGHHSFFALIEKNANVFSFEPNNKVFNDLKKIKKSLDLNSKMKIFNCGCGSEEKQSVLNQFNFESGNASFNEQFISDRTSIISLFEKAINLLTFKKPIKQKIEIKKLDDLIDLDVKVDLIKIDTEGNELDCLLGAKKVIEKSRPHVVFEIHVDKKGSYSDFANFFTSYEYQSYEIIPQIETNECFYKPISKLEPLKSYNILASPSNL